jgi:hypothetical protein
LTPPLSSLVPRQDLTYLVFDLGTKKTGVGQKTLVLILRLILSPISVSGQVQEIQSLQFNLCLTSFIKIRSFTNQTPKSRSLVNLISP